MESPRFSQQLTLSTCSGVVVTKALHLPHGARRKLSLVGNNFCVLAFNHGLDPTMDLTLRVCNTIASRMVKRKRESVLPPARLLRTELWLKFAAKQRNLNFSEYLRLRLLHPSKLRRVSTRKPDEREKVRQEKVCSVGNRKRASKRDRYKRPAQS